VRALHPWTAAISMPPLSTFLFPARPIRIYKQTHADSLLARANFGPTNGVHFTDVTCYDLQLSVATGVER
jgi:hypothetical protein